MYLRITRGSFDPVNFDRIQPTAREINDAIKRRPGNRSIVQGADRTDGTIAAVSTWDTEEQARFSRDELGDAITRLGDLGVRMEDPEVYEVTIE